MRYKDVNSSLEAHIQTLRTVLAVLIVINVLVIYGWHQAKQDIRLHIPPDTRSGAVVAAGEINPANIFGFTHTIFQQLNHWEKDGEKDYGLQIYRMAAYLTPAFREYLVNDLDVRGKRGELTGRVRIIQMMPGHGYEERRVDIIDANTWVVWLDYTVQETVRGMAVKHIPIRYPIRVVRYDIDPEVNPWGLALAGFANDGPARLSDAEIERNSVRTNS